MNRASVVATTGSSARARAIPGLVLVALAGAGPDPVATQAPATDIYVAELTLTEGEVMVGSWANVTDRDGYDNQPSFEPRGRSILYTSMRDGQTDTYKYDLVAGRSERVTHTPESEYSPTYMLETDRFSAVRVEADSTQRLWSFSRDGSDPQLLLPDIAPVGYHAWADPERVALFVLGSPPTLRLAHPGPGPGQQRMENIGRSLHRVPGRLGVSFLVKGDEWWIHVLDLETDRIQRIARALEGGEDYTWTPNGLLLMGRESRLYSLDPEAGGDWMLVANLADVGIQGITRIAVSPDGRHVALVGVRPGD
jgi:hypothetical protein